MKFTRSQEEIAKDENRRMKTSTMDENVKLDRFEDQRAEF